MTFLGTSVPKENDRPTNEAHHDTRAYYESLFKKTCELGDIYEKKKRLVKLSVELEGLIGHDEGLGGSLGDTSETFDVISLLDRVRRVADECHVSLGDSIAEEPGALGHTQEEGVGDIDELLGGLTLNTAGSALQDSHQRQKHVFVRPGRRYKKVVRKTPGNGGGGVVVTAREHDAESDVDDDVVAGVGAGGMLVTSSEDEEKKRYFGQQKDGGAVKKNDDLKVEIPVSTDVLAQAIAHDCLGASPVTSGSTRACGGRADVPGTYTTDEYDSDESITSPAVQVAHTMAKGRGW